MTRFDQDNLYCCPLMKGRAGGQLQSIRASLQYKLHAGSSKANKAHCHWWAQKFSPYHLLGKQLCCYELPYNTVVLRGYCLFLLVRPCFLNKTQHMLLPRQVNNMFARILRSKNDRSIQSYCGEFIMLNFARREVEHFQKCVCDYGTWHSYTWKCEEIVDHVQSPGEAGQH